MGHVLDGKLSIVRKLGRGGTGAVYRVVDTKTQEEYAIKVLAPQLVGSEQSLQNLRNEVAVANRLAHKRTS